MSIEAVKKLFEDALGDKISPMAREWGKRGAVLIARLAELEAENARLRAKCEVLP